MDTSYSKKEGNTENLEDNSEYRQAIGALLCISIDVKTRPNVSLAANKLSRKNKTPTKKDWTALKKLIMYLNTTKDFNLVIKSISPPFLTCTTDVDWTSDTSTRSSTSGNVFLIGSNHISWFSKRQNCIALSSCESEYIAAAQEIQWLIYS
ncbi:retrovirus-related Pol polyprotein from transposon TNT 1-94 [Nephila pilipes]|uniref:Retrovirus-related Pol polyprotein from transposon TNT 1-94 n=1 Tax=Nephila pilipes TaxID=299642 RepID=A0A8X6I6P0_NEPPI|nr:retrovirus-related Pol polyprotein from transposon TNT 1-94 [Nephila pilipes]